jgi:DNA-binding response OmpR family regulator
MLTLVCRGLAINPETRRAFVERRVLDLPEKEFLLLRVLSDRPGLVLSGRLYTLIWGGTESSTLAPNRLRRMVERLRQRIGRKWVESIRGRGYRLAIKEGM